MNPPFFSQSQQDWICYQIGAWYAQWKHHIVDDGIQHRLGHAKEELKNMICPLPAITDKQLQEIKELEKAVTIDNFCEILQKIL